MISRIKPLLVLFLIATIGALPTTQALLAQSPSQPVALASEDGTKLLLGERVLLNGSRDGFISIRRVIYSPDRGRFVVVSCGYECNDNIGHVLKADGSGKSKITSRWDHILQEVVEWSGDSRTLYYYRISSSAADPPKNAPRNGWVEIDVASGRKRGAVSRRLKTEATYSVISSLARGGIEVKASLRRSAGTITRLPADAKGIRITGAGRSISHKIWVPVTFRDLSGWVDQNYLVEERRGDDRSPRLFATNN